MCVCGVVKPSIFERDKKSSSYPFLFRLRMNLVNRAYASLRKRRYTIIRSSKGVFVVRVVRIKVPEKACIFECRVAFQSSPAQVLFLSKGKTQERGHLTDLLPR